MMAAVVSSYLELGCLFMGLGGVLFQIYQHKQILLLKLDIQMQIRVKLCPLRILIIREGGALGHLPHRPRGSTRCGVRTVKAVPVHRALRVLQPAPIVKKKKTVPCFP